MKNRKIWVAAAIIVLIVVAGLVVVELILPGLTPPTNSGTPVITSQFGDIKTKVKTAAPAPTTGGFNTQPDGIEFVSYVTGPARSSRQAQVQFSSCTKLRGATATPTGGPTATAQATLPATSEPASTQVAGEPDFIVLQIVGPESEACYQVGEFFVDSRNRFNLAIGVTNAINGEVAIDRANLANSRVGDIVIDISQLQSDDRLRDGQIRRRWLESNKYPLAKLTQAKIIGLPARPYQEGEVLNFKILGTMQVREATQSMTWDVTASLAGSTLSGTATTDFKMTDFGFDPPEIAGTLKANNDVHLIFNFVAREPGAAATAAK